MGMKSPAPFRVVCAFAILSYPMSVSFGQTENDELRAVLAAFQKGRLMRVGLLEGGAVDGWYQGHTNESLFVSQPGVGVNTIELNEVTGIWRHKGTRAAHGFFLGGAIGAVALGTTFYLIGSPYQSESEPTESKREMSFGLLGAFIGVLAGGVVGWMIGLARPIWVQAYP